MRHAPDWASNAASRHFLLQKLQLPAAWLDQSLAQWAHYCHDDFGELEHLLDAQLWSEAHQLLCLRLAPQLFLASYSQDGFAPTEQQQHVESKLQGFLSQMSTHHQQLAPPASMLTQPEADWYLGGLPEGAGVYSTYYGLRDEFKTAGNSGSSKSQQRRMAEYLRFSKQLEAVSPLWCRGPSSRLRQIVLSELAGQVAGWVLKDAAAVLPPPEAILLAKPPSTLNVLEMQLSADWLAQHAE